MKKICVALLLLCAFLSPRPAFAAEAKCTRCTALREEGFPEDYLEGLCALQILHPEWKFIPLPITSLSREKGLNYTFSVVLEEECGVWERSLISGSEEFSPYRSTSGGRTDTGAWCASREAVAYFLDPRNALTRRGIFQFLSLSYEGRGGAEAVARVLEGTAVKKIVSPQVIYRIGEEAGVDPLFLAVRLRQEQGQEGNPLLWGTAGTTLSRWYAAGVRQEGGRLVQAPVGGRDGAELLSLDGYFNPFNVSAGGLGAFAVYESGARHAKKMGWDTVEKALEGGVKKIAEEYVARYQGTLYLQKWNVDPRSLGENGASRNFWGQYMQNVSAAKTEGDLLFSLYEEAGLLSQPLSFLIPVYQGLPPEPCPDPGEGKVLLTAADPAEISPHAVPTLAPVITEGEKEEEVKEEWEEKKALSPAKQILFVVIFLFASGGILLLFIGVTTRFICNFFEKKTKQ
ncbi:MAG: hypothetical protein IKD18_04785 [Clostridia bacterium]|nr:hypothetical protein [Clostridia bacterium]